MAAQLVRLFVVPASLVLCSVAGAQESPAVVDAVPLPDDEIQQITLSLIQRYPQLASSPGVKAAGASAGGPDDTVAIYVIFYPHTETHGIKEAFETLCQREEHPSKKWVCNDPTIRRYVQLASQDFEVRIKGEITSEAALALIEASRRDLHATATGYDLPNTAIMVHAPRDGRILVDWGTPQGLSKVMMLGQLTDGGDPTDPDDWHATVLK